MVLPLSTMLLSSVFTARQRVAQEVGKGMDPKPSHGIAVAQ